MAMKENSVKVLNYLKGINGADVTAADVEIGRASCRERV